MVLVCAPTQQVSATRVWMSCRGPERSPRSSAADHHEVLVTADDFRENWTKLSWHRDGPLSEPADVAVFKLAQLARRDVKVILSGEGSDELFAGYPKHRFARATRIAGLIPAELRAAALRVLEPALRGQVCPASHCLARHGGG